MFKINQPKKEEFKKTSGCGCNKNKELNKKELEKKIIQKTKKQYKFL